MKHEIGNIYFVIGDVAEFGSVITIVDKYIGSTKSKPIFKYTILIGNDPGLCKWFEQDSYFDQHLIPYTLNIKDLHSRYVSNTWRNFRTGTVAVKVNPDMVQTFIQIAELNNCNWGFKSESDAVIEKIISNAQQLNLDVYFYANGNIHNEFTFSFAPPKQKEVVTFDLENLV